MEPAPRKKHPEHAVLLDRNLLDEELRRSAVDAGVIIMDSPIGAVKISPSGGGWEIVQNDHAPWQAAFLVDAAGRRSVMNMRRNLLGPRTLAIETRWNGVAIPKWATYLEALSSAWIWAVRDGSDLTLVTTFVSSDWLSTNKADVASRLRDLLQPSRLASLSRFMKLKFPPRVREATPSSADNQIGRSYLRVGDASLAVDPIASQGCQQALISGFQGAVVVNTCLSRPNAYPLAEEFVVARLREAIALHVRNTREAYRQQSLFQTRFWSDRHLPEASSIHSRDGDQTVVNKTFVAERIQLSPLIQLRLAPALIGNLIECVPAIFHPSWTRPIAFIGRQSAADLIKDLECPIATNRLIETWAGRFESSYESARELLNRLWQMGFFVSANEPTET
jgi:flavin-dependent dehydrogenase